MPYEDYAKRIQDQVAKYSHRYQPSLPSYVSGRQEPTDAERETYRYVLEEQAKRDRRKKLLQPVEAILDLLNRGQYLTANMTQNVVDYAQGERDNLELGKAALEGITGKRKGDYEDIIEDLGWNPETKAGKFAKGATGFLANVLLDPTTYIGFGPAKAAKAAATGATKDAIKMLNTLKGMNIDEIPEAILKNIDASKLKGLSDPKDLAKYLSKSGADDTARVMNDLFKETYKKNLRTPADTLRSQMSDMATATRDQLDDAMLARLAESGGNLEDAYTLLGQPDEFRQFLDKIIYNSKKGDLYGGAGMRSWKFMGKEFAASERNPLPVQAFDKAREVFKKSKIGGIYSDAVWSVLDKPTSIVGKLKAAFNVRNPYQKALEAIATDIREEVPVSTKNYVDRIRKITTSLTDDEKKLVRDRMITLQTNSRLPADEIVPIESVADIAIEKKINSAIEEINKLTGSLDAEDFEGWAGQLRKYQSEGLIKDVGVIENYLPIQESGSRFYKKVGTVRGHMGPAPLRTRELTWGEHVTGQVEKLKWLYGVDTATAEKIVTEGLSDLNMDLEKMLVVRAMGQAKIEARVQMLKEFRGFGIHLNDMSKDGTDLLRTISREGSAIQQLGLRTVEDHALRGYLFDNDVARVLERALSVTQRDESISGIAGWIRSFNTMWKGWATLSPGFHARNEISNQITGFLNHGVKWFDPGNALESTVATYVGLYGEETAEKIFSKTIGRAKFKSVLAKQYGGRTIRELSDYATKKGVVTRATMAFDMPGTVEDFLKPKFNAKRLNPMSTEFAPLDVSKNLGSLIESQSKMNNFLLDFKDVAKYNTSDAALDWAKNNTKKWFLDYGDLSQFEQKVMKNIIPFYSWLRKNTANQIAGLVELTPMYSMLAKELNALQNAEGIEKEALPEYMRELGYMPSFDIGENNIAMFWPNIPLFDLNKIPFKFEFNENGIPIPVPQGPGEVIKEIAASANPALKTLVEIIPEDGWHTFYQTPLGKQRQAPGLTQVFKENGIVVPFIDGLLRSVGVEEGLRAGTDENGNLLIDGKLAQILENNLPQLKRIPEFFDAPELMIPALREFENKITGKEDTYDATEMLFKVLSFNIGIKFKAFDEEEFHRREAEDILKAAEEARAEDRRELPQAQQRRTQYITSRLNKQRRMGLL